jgi:hypothetical protein
VLEHQQALGLEFLIPVLPKTKQKKLEKEGKKGAKMFWKEGRKEEGRKGRGEGGKEEGREGAIFWISFEFQEGKISRWKNLSGSWQSGLETMSVDLRIVHLVEKKAVISQRRRTSAVPSIWEEDEEKEPREGTFRILDICRQEILKWSGVQENEGAYMVCLLGNIEW